MMTSTIGLTIDFHYCGNELQSYAFLGKAKKCDKGRLQSETQVQAPTGHACCHKKKETTSKACHQSKDAIESSKCCSSKTIHVENDVVDQSLVMQSIILKLMVTQIVANYNNGFPSSLSKQEHFFQYKPPPIVTDVHLQYQVFRI